MVKKTLDDYGRIYLDFLQRVKVARRLPAFPLLDLAEERLLDQLAASWYAGKKITVLKAMEMSPDASSTTVHRRLKTLRLKLMLELEVDEDDNRVKYILPTDLARNYLAELGRAVEQSYIADHPNPSSVFPDGSTSSTPSDSALVPGE